MASTVLRALRRGGVSFRPSPSVPAEQRRWEGNLPIVKNKYIEEWSTRREEIEKEFRWTPKNVVILFLTCVAFPVFLFKMTILQFDYLDASQGRQRRRFWPRDSPRDY